MLAYMYIHYIGNIIDNVQTLYRPPTHSRALEAETAMHREA